MVWENVLAKFKELFGGEGEIGVYFAPGRVNMIGEHTDYNGGHVFPCALTIGTYGVARKREDKKLRFYSMNFEQLGVLESSVENLKPEKEADWTNYPKGVMWAFGEKGMKELLIGGAGIGIIGLVVILTTPLLLFGAFFSGEAKDENDITWSIHDYVSAMSQKQVKSYADDVIGLYNKLKDDNEIITLYNNLSGEEIAIEKDTILSSIPNADDFTNIIEPVFNVLMITRYSMTVEESQKKETYVYLWNLLNNLYSEKLSMEYCDSPDEDGVYYAKETCLRSSDTKYHKKYSGRNCCEESYSCKGHTSYCTDLSKCTNKTIAGKCGGHTTYCTDADLKSCTNKEYHFKCNGYKECLGHRRTRIVMDFNGINALIAEEFDEKESFFDKVKKLFGK